MSNVANQNQRSNSTWASLTETLSFRSDCAAKSLVKSIAKINHHPNIEALSIQLWGKLSNIVWFSPTNFDAIQVSFFRFVLRSDSCICCLCVQDWMSNTMVCNAASVGDSPSATACSSSQPRYCLTSSLLLWSSLESSWVVDSPCLDAALQLCPSPQAQEQTPVLLTISIN